MLFCFSRLEVVVANQFPRTPMPLHLPQNQSLYSILDHQVLSVQVPGVTRLRVKFLGSFRAWVRALLVTWLKVLVEVVE